MPTNLHIDSDLLEQAQRLGHHRTKRETVNEALVEYIQYRKRVEAVEAFGTIDFDPEYDYKKIRMLRITDISDPIPFVRGVIRAHFEHSRSLPLKKTSNPRAQRGSCIR